jgi:hypothetical protein
LTAAAAAVSVILVAAAVSILLSGQPSGRGQAGGDPLAGVAGYRWRLIELIDTHGTLSAPASLPALIAFTHDGHVLGDDTVNALQGDYQPTPGGYTVRQGGGTFVGAPQGDPIRSRIIAAVDAMFFSIVPNPDQTPPALTVDVKLTGDTLTLRHGDTSLTLRRAGTQPDYFAQPPSPTPTTTG